MKTIVFHDSKRNPHDTLHIETDGCIVNIRVGLTKDDGRKCTVIEVIPDGYKGEEWDLEVGSLFTRIVERKQSNNFCVKCGCHYSTHNDDGSCVVD